MRAEHLREWLQEQKRRSKIKGLRKGERKGQRGDIEVEVGRGADTDGVQGRIPCRGGDLAGGGPNPKVGAETTAE